MLIKLLDDKKCRELISISLKDLILIFQKLEAQSTSFEVYISKLKVLDLDQPIEKRCKQTNGHAISTVKQKEFEIRLSKWRTGIKYLFNLELEL